MQSSKQAAYLRFCILSVLGTAALSATAAEINTAEGTLPQVELDKITVTATRTPTKISNTIAQSRVIDSEELKRYQGQTALEVIMRQPGFSHYTNGGMGTANNFYVRGYDSKQTLVLIDGVRYSSLSLGTPALNLLPADQIDRIEILYGASGSSIYGADAMGGVIQVFTKGANVDKTNFSVTAGAGSHDHYTYGANAQFANGSGTTMSVGASRNQTDGFNATDPSSGEYTYNPDDDGFKSNNFSAALNQRINDQWLVGTSALYSKSTTDFDAGAANNAIAKQENGAAQAFVDWRYLPGSSLKLQYGHSIDKSDNPTYQSVYNTKQDQISLVGQHKLPVGQGIYGLEYLNQGIDTSQYNIDDRDVKSAFLGYMLASPQFDAQANLRFDDNSQYGDKTTYNLGGAYHISSEFRVGANYAKGFRAPTFNDLYYPGSGNLNLKPETSDNYEAFAEFNNANQVTRLTGYHNKVNDLIGYVPKPTPEDKWAGRSENFAEAKIKGISLTSDWVINDYLFGGSYDYQQAKDSSGSGNDGNFLPYRPKHKGLVYAGYRLPSLDLRAEYQYVDDYFSGIANSESQLVNNYGLFNISGTYQFSDHLSMTTRLNNITNKKYITTPGYNTDGTNFFTSLTYNWF